MGRSAFLTLGVFRGAESRWANHFGDRSRLSCTETTAHGAGALRTFRNNRANETSAQSPDHRRPGRRRAVPLVPLVAPGVPQEASPAPPRPGPRRPTGPLAAADPAPPAPPAPAPPLHAPPRVPAPRKVRTPRTPNPLRPPSPVLLRLGSALGLRPSEPRSAVPEVPSSSLLDMSTLRGPCAPCGTGAGPRPAESKMQRT